MIHLCSDLVTPQFPGEKERESGQFYEVFPVFELILYLQGQHEYSSKHSSFLFNKRYLCQHTRHSCFNCSIRVEMNRQQLLGAVPSGYPNPTRYPVFLSIPDPTRFSFRNHRVAGNPKHRVLPDISGKPEVSGTTRYFGYHP